MRLRRALSSAPLSFAPLLLTVLSVCCACGQPAAAPVARAPNLITNGDFSGGIAPWGAHLAGVAEPAHSVQQRLLDGALCTEVQGGQEVIVGWPVSGSTDSFSLVAGQKYELALRASASGASVPTCVIKVGHQLAPYTAAFSTSLSVGQASQLFEFTFAPDHPDDRAGIAVECRAAPSAAPAEVCVDDVSLR